MPLWTIGDLHLSLGVDKPMDVFGGGWSGYLEKLERGMSLPAPDDTVVLLGDISWGMSLEESAPDFRWIADKPGRKYIIKGNHDYWWTTRTKMTEFWRTQGFENIDVIHNDCRMYGDIALCGSRGWFYEENGTGKVYKREILRLKASLDAGRAAGARELICFLHYPPLYEGYRCDEIVDLMTDYGVRRCYCGHLHGQARQRAIEGEYKGVKYTLVSADHVDFTPVKVE